ncbi:MAG TPA: hypothetical protein ENL06_00465 [Candidatus Portnoybacteria bacterium]|nr:hypothetical protein [Candidatus Portnoybacteria bacterium]
MEEVTISKKEYKELLQLRKGLDQILKKVIPTDIIGKKPMKSKDLLEFAKLKIKGGPKNLSKKIDSYLYE